MKRKLLFLTFALALVIGGCKAEKEVAVDGGTTANTDDVQTIDASDDSEDISDDAELTKDYTEDIQEEIFDYFRNSETDDLQTAFDELGLDDYKEEEIRLVRIKFLSEMGN